MADDSHHSLLDAQRVHEGLQMYAEIFKHALQSFAKGAKVAAGKAVDGVQSAAARGGKLVQSAFPKPDPTPGQGKGPVENSLSAQKAKLMEQAGPNAGQIRDSFAKYGLDSPEMQKTFEGIKENFHKTADFNAVQANVPNAPAVEFSGVGLDELGTGTAPSAASSTSRNVRVQSR